MLSSELLRCWLLFQEKLPTGPFGERNVVEFLIFGDTNVDFEPDEPCVLVCLSAGDFEVSLSL